MFFDSIGSVIGIIGNYSQERFYQCVYARVLHPLPINFLMDPSSKNVARVGPEARLYSACIAGVTVVFGAMIYAWTLYSFVHWIAPCIGITIMIASIFTVYLAVFNYLADGAYSHEPCAVLVTDLISLVQPI